MTKQILEPKYKVLETITEFNKPIKIYDPSSFLIDDREYCFPFDNKDSSPTAKQWSGRSLGRIEWLIEPRKFEWDKSSKRFYIKQILVWATQTRDKRYAGKIFGINCNTESLSGIAHKFREYEQGVLNQVWRLQFSAVTKTPILDTYPDDNFNLLYIHANSSISLDIKYLRFDLLPTDFIHYKQIWKLHHQKREYTE